MALWTGLNRIGPDPCYCWASAGCRRMYVSVSLFNDNLRTGEGRRPTNYKCYCSHKQGNQQAGRRGLSVPGWGRDETERAGEDRMA